VSERGDNNNFRAVELGVSRDCGGAPSARPDALSATSHSRPDLELVSIDTAIDLCAGADHVVEVTVRSAGGRAVEGARLELLDLGAPRTLARLEPRASTTESFAGLRVRTLGLPESVRPTAVVDRYDVVAEANELNNRKDLTVPVSGRCPRGGVLPYDLRVDFLLPTRAVVDGRPAVNLGVRIANLSPEPSPANGVTILRRRKDIGDNREKWIGAPGTFEPLLALDPNEMVLLHPTNRSPPLTGSVSYRVHFANPVRDADVSNDSAELRLRYQRTAETDPAGGPARLP